MECVKCGRPKADAEFYSTTRRGRVEVDASCKSCKKAQSNLWYHTHKICTADNGLFSSQGAHIEERGLWLADILRDEFDERGRMRAVLESI